MSKQMETRQRTRAAAAAAGTFRHPDKVGVSPSLGAIGQADRIRRLEAHNAALRTGLQYMLAQCGHLEKEADYDFSNERALLDDIPPPTNAPGLNIGRFILFNEIDAPYPRYVVGAGDSRAGQRGAAIATIGLKHAGGYEVVLRLDSGKVDSFSPMQLFAEPR